MSSQHLVSKSTLLIVLFSLLACTNSKNGPHQNIEQEPQQQATNTDTSILFGDVKPIFEKNCMSCHFTAVQAPKINWVDYTSAKKKADDTGARGLQAKIKSGSMPPEKGSFTDQDAALILAWISSGALENNSPTANDDGNAPTNNDELPPQLTALEQDPVASAQCIGCHGSKGMSYGGAPHLAGLSEAYILDQLKSFSWKYKEGFENEEPSFENIVSKYEDVTPRIDSPDNMTSIVSSLKEEDLISLAKLFSEETYDSSAAELEDLTVRETVLNYVSGMEIVEKAACLSCHNDISAPKITGQNRYYIENSLFAFYDGIRKNKSMEAVVKSSAFSEENFADEVAAVGLYLSQLANDKQQTFSMLTPADTEVSYEKNCATCHSSDPPDPRVPRLSGLKSRYIKNELKGFASGKRTDEIFYHMNKVAGLLSSEQTEDVAKYISDELVCASELPTTEEETPQALAASNDDGGAATAADPTIPLVLTEDELQIERGKKVFKGCRSCHSSRGSGPKIQGQRESYLTYVLTNFKNDRNYRKGTMNSRARRLSDENIQDVAKYLSSLNRCEQ